MLWIYLLYRLPAVDSCALTLNAQVASLPLIANASLFGVSAASLVTYAVLPGYLPGLPTLYMYMLSQRAKGATATGRGYSDMTGYGDRCSDCCRSQRLATMFSGASRARTRKREGAMRAAARRWFANARALMCVTCGVRAESNRRGDLWIEGCPPVWDEVGDGGEKEDEMRRGRLSAVALGGRNQVYAEGA
eukprot:6206706-Pleurochrysis_carterae.AAC.2